MGKKAYSHKDIKVMSEIAHLRANPGMYIGETNNPNHLVSEVLDNALDEAIAGFAKLVGVVIDNKNDTCSILDNGRGIPIENNTIKTISTKLFSGGKFNKGKGSKAYGVACLVGNTKIKLLDGRDITIKEMADNPDEEYWVLSSTVDGKWKAAKAQFPQVTGYVKKLIKVHIDNNECIECTPDHKFLMKNGSYMEAKDLKSGDSLMPCYTTIQDGYTMIRPNNTYEYIRNIQFDNRGYHPLHKIVYESLNGGKIPVGHAIHHNDVIRSNNYPSNLQCVKADRHLAIHAKINSDNGTVYSDSLVKYNKSERGRKKSRENGLTTGAEAFRKYTKSGKHKKDKHDYMKQYNKIPGIQLVLTNNKIKKFGKTLLNENLEITEENWEKYRPYGIPKFRKVITKFDNNYDQLLSECINHDVAFDSINITNSNAMMITRLYSILDKVCSLSLPMTIDSFNNVRNQFDPKEQTIIKLFKSFDNFVTSHQTNNHKVVKIEYIDMTEEVPVYDIHVPVYSNFVTTAGVVVHNSGLHGIGLVAVTALSQWTTFTIYRDGKKAFYKFERAVLKEETIEEFTGDIPYSTKISFKADKKIFESLKFNVKQIKARLDLASVHIPTLQLIYIVDNVKEIINCDANQYFTDTMLNGKASKECTPIFDITKSIEDEKLHIKFCWDLGSSTVHKESGSINLLPVDQGTHVNMTLLLFKKVFDELCKKKKLKFNSNDCLLSFRCHISMMLYKPEYSSQTKERLSMTKTKLQDIFDFVETELKNILNNNPETTDKILAFFDAYRKKVEVGKNIVKSATVNRMNNVIDSKLRDCTSTLVAKTELFITEGSSAAGSLIQCRNPKYHGILGLKGKIPNVAAIKYIKDILKNKEIIEIVNALGTGVEPDFTLNTLRYGKVIISTDADSDGCIFFQEKVLTRFNNSIEKISLEQIVNNKDKYLNYMVLGYDTNSNEFKWTEILHIWDYKEFDESIELEMEDGEVINLTSDHLVLTKRGYVEAKLLTEEDEVIDYGNRKIEEFV